MRRGAPILLALVLAVGILPVVGASESDIERKVRLKTSRQLKEILTAANVEFTKTTSKVLPVPNSAARPDKTVATPSLPLPTRRFSHDCARAQERLRELVLEHDALSIFEEKRAEEKANEATGGVDWGTDSAEPQGANDFMGETIGDTTDPELPPQQSRARVDDQDEELTEEEIEAAFAEKCVPVASPSLSKPLLCRTRRRRR